MAYSNAAASPGDAGSGRTDATFRAAFGLYAGALLAGVATTGATATLSGGRTTLGVVAVGSFLLGVAAGSGLAGRLHGLPARLGRTWLRQLGVVCSALPFVAVIAASSLGALESTVGLAALGSTLAVGISGLVLARVAENSYVDAATAGIEPVARWRWDWSPSGLMRILDLFMIVAWSLSAAVNAVGGDWWGAVLWTGFAVGVAVISVAEGRWAGWLPRGTSDPATVAVYEHGFATERPFRRQFVPWSAVSHVRLQGDEIVVDRRTFGHRFDRDDLEDPDAVLETIDRRLEATDER